jgi:hypothetical protein
LAKYSISTIPGVQFNEYSGPTTNRSEGLNDLYKGVQGKELPLDMCVLSTQRF